MKNTIRQVFHSAKFVVGFIIFVAILLLIIFYPLFHPGNPLEMIGVGTFAKPGIYFSLYDSVTTETEILKLPDAADNRLDAVLSQEDRIKMVAWLSAMGVNIEGLDYSNTDALMELWRANYDEKARPEGMTKAERNYYKRLNASLSGMGSAGEMTVTERTPPERNSRLPPLPRTTMST